jgi:hypothetical protein
VGEKSYDEHIEGVTGPSEQRFGALGAALQRGVGAEAQKEFATLMGAASAMPGIGSEAADEMAGWRANGAVMPQHRTQKADEVRETAKLMLKAHHDSAVGAAGRLEGWLVHGLLPRPHADRQQRVLVQGEIRNIIGNATGQDLVRKTMALLGSNAEHDSEILSSFGESLFKGAGVEDRFAQVKTQAVERYLSRKDGTEKQQLTRKALLEFKAANVAGSIAAYQHAGNMHLRRDDNRQRPETAEERDARERRSQRQANQREMPRL